MKLKSDLHIHTSEDPVDNGFINYNAFELIDMAKQRGLDVIAITHHDSMADICGLGEYADTHNIILILGIEKTIEKKHVIFLNVDSDKIHKIKKFDDIEYIKEDENLIIAPHPFFPHGNSLNSKLKRYVKYFDAIEFTGFYFRYINFSKKAATFASAYRMPVIGCSDAHSKAQIGMTYSIIESERNINSIINAVKSNKVKIITEPLPVNFENISIASGFIRGAFKSMF